MYIYAHIVWPMSEFSMRRSSLKNRMTRNPRKTSESYEMYIVLYYVVLHHSVMYHSMLD